MNKQLLTGDELTFPAYLLDDAAAKAYGAAIQSPPVRKRRENIHSDRDAAQRAGFAAPIAAGEQTYAVLAQALADYFGRAFLNGGILEVSFVKPVLYGDRLSPGAKVVERKDTELRLELTVCNQRGEPVAIGSARVPLG